ncbi:MAG: isoaspartyl peptidase/L-asparaginase family protein [Flavobacteriaceae bacterium]|tara:strand:- start:10933 stop:11937 length:1005 start_codon:yes stop_codon:yes gene_type:complete
MKKKYILIFVFGLLISCNENKNQSLNFSIVIHGGAGTMEREKMSVEKELEYKKKLGEALNKGYEILENNGSSERAVIEAIKIMEDSPLFNAGKGAVLDERGEVSLDASFMNGENLNAGAIAGVKKIKNPIIAAYSVMKNTPQVLLISEGADEFAKEQGLTIVNNSYFITERRMSQFLKNKTLSQLKDKKESSLTISKFGTVGCVALDKNGNLSAGTSTGGRSNKKWGRVGDVPIIGAGNYANNNTCAISATGWGEFFIRNVVAHDISSLLEYKQLDIKQAAKISLDKVKKLGGSGGVIALDKFGNYAMEFNTKGMYRGVKDSRGNFKVSIFKND